MRDLSATAKGSHIYKRKRSGVESLISGGDAAETWKLRAEDSLIIGLRFNMDQEIQRWISWSSRCWQWWRMGGKIEVSEQAGGNLPCPWGALDRCGRDLKAWRLSNGCRKRGMACSQADVEVSVGVVQSMEWVLEALKQPGIWFEQALLHSRVHGTDAYWSGGAAAEDIVTSPGHDGNWNTDPMPPLGQRAFMVKLRF